MFNMDNVQIHDPNDPEVNFTVLNEFGEEAECTILFTMDDPRTGLHYIVYTDYSTDEDGNINVLANIFDPDNEESELLPIEDDAIWEAIAQILEACQD